MRSIRVWVNRRVYHANVTLMKVKMWCAPSQTSWLSPALVSPLVGWLGVAELNVMLNTRFSLAPNEHIYTSSSSPSCKDWPLFIDKSPSLWITGVIMPKWPIVCYTPTLAPATPRHHHQHMVHPLTPLRVWLSLKINGHSSGNTGWIRTAWCFNPTN